ncbi:hypothetical protein IU449_27035 [Nocardia higoensis]|uniref:Uncharacterized protein n=1 Tax=Nocardia higoensis TaxID=228599 RepID=A0ABS0DI67_9NOCA|nr:hypothetical protein [Nocardia higoensis]MBF6358156.1 hypothetical protein [Nocardia higoensis]
MNELKVFQQCPPELLPARNGDACAAWDCDLAYQHVGDCAVVSLSGMVIEVMQSLSDTDCDWWE